MIKHGDMKLGRQMIRASGRTVNFLDQFDLVEVPDLEDNLFVFANKQGKVVKKLTCDQFALGAEMHPDTAVAFCGTNNFDVFSRFLPMAMKSIGSGLMQGLNAELKH
jgi:hypothetical protein